MTNLNSALEEMTRSIGRVGHSVGSRCFTAAKIFLAPFLGERCAALHSLPAPRLRSHAQTLKSGTLSLVVPFAAGGPSDVAGRILAQGMQETLGQTVVVENPVGGGGTVGSLRVSRGTPDGSAFVLGNNGTHSWSQSLYKNPAYDTTKGFHGAGARGRVAARHHRAEDLPANTLQEFIAYVKANQDKIQFASAGAGSASHVSCVLLNAMLGVNVTHVPYRGLGPAMQDLIAGRVQYICDSVSTSKPQIEGGSSRRSRPRG